MRSVDTLKGPSLYNQFNKEYKITCPKDTQIKFKDKVYIFSYIKKSDDIYQLMGTGPMWGCNTIEVLANREGEPCYSRALIKSVGGKLYVHFCKCK